MIATFIRRLAALTALFLVLAAPASAFAAFDIKNNVDCQNARDSTFCSTTPGNDPLSGPEGIIHKATGLISVIAGVAAVLIMVIAGIRYITSGGDAETVSSAKRTIIYAAIGLVVIVVARTVINLVVSKV